MRKFNKAQRQVLLPSKAQASIEFTIAIIASIILLVGTIKIFIWVNQCIIDRQVAFQNTRIQPIDSGNINRFYEPPKLEIFQ